MLQHLYIVTIYYDDDKTILSQVKLYAENEKVLTNMIEIFYPYAKTYSIEKTIETRRI